MRRVLPIIAGIAGVAVAAGAGLSPVVGQLRGGRLAGVAPKREFGALFRRRDLASRHAGLDLARSADRVEAARHRDRRAGGRGRSSSAAAAMSLVATPWKVRKPSDGARIATMADLKRAGLLDGVAGYSMLLGTFKGRDVRYSGDSHFYVNGPSRSGKGRGFVMPNLLEWRGSAIVLDVKQENWRLTGAARVALGQKVYLDSRRDPRHSHRWNPLDFVRPWPSRATDLAESGGEPDRRRRSSGEAYWAETARSLLAGVLGYVTDSATMEGRRNIALGAAHVQRRRRASRSFSMHDHRERAGLERLRIGRLPPAHRRATSSSALPSKPISRRR